MAQVTVIGLSSFGYFLARRLSELGSQVLALDRNEDMINRIKERGPHESTFLPQPDTIIKDGHLLVLMGSNRDLDRLQRGP